MAVELATAYISLVPSTKDFAEKAMKEIAPGMQQEGVNAGDKLLAGIGKTLKAGAVGVGIAAAAGIGTALVKGFSRLGSLDQATAKLSGLGHSAETVQGIMDNALAAVKGTAFGMDEAASTAAGAVAAGIKPGLELEKVLKLTADAATIAGTDMGSMGSIFNKVAASGKLQGDVIAQLQDAGVPILQMVAQQMGVTAGEAADMASKGEVSFDTFRNAMESGLGGAALESGATFSGAMDNMMASVGRIGANILSGVFPQMKDGLGGLTEVLAPIEEKAKEIGAAFGDFVADVGPKLVGVFKGIGDAASSSVKFVQDNIAWIGPLAAAFTGAAAALLIWKGAIAVWQAATKIAAAVQLAFNVVLAANPIMLVIMAIIALVAAIIWVATQTTFFQDAWAAVSTWFVAVWEGISAFFVTVWNGIIAFFQGALQWLIDMFMQWTIYGLIISNWEAISAFFAGLWQGIIGFFTDAWNNILGVITTVQATFQLVFEAIAGIITGAFDGVVNVVKGVINGIIDLVNGAIGGISDVAGAVGGAFGMDISLGSIPRLADGGIVSKRPGGILANVGEGRYDEAVVPLTPQFMDALAGNGNGGGSGAAIEFNVNTVHGQSNSEIAQIAANDLADTLRGLE